MRVDDFVCLGRTVPEESKKYGQRVCMAGISTELGVLMRVYPLPVINPVRMRCTYRMELMRNHLDSRRESWKLQDRCNIATVSSKPIPYPELGALTCKHLSSSITELNLNRDSLGIIKPQGVECRFESRKGVASSLQETLWNDLDCAFGANSIDLIPRVRFYDEDGPHDLQLREWGCYEFIRKHRSQAGDLWKILGFGKGDYDVAFVVGNMCHQRNAWLIVSVLKLRKSVQAPTLFDMDECEVTLQ